MGSLQSVTPEANKTEEATLQTDNMRGVSDPHHPITLSCIIHKNKQDLQPTKLLYINNLEWKLLKHKREEGEDERYRERERKSERQTER